MLYEYPRVYEAKEGQIPYYAILNAQNLALHARYREAAALYPRLHMLGRLAEYKYYNMDAITGEALRLARSLLS